jgi:predicted transcriptional regulator
MIITGEMLKRLRIDAGLTQTELARLVGVSQAHIAKIEQGKVDPRLSTINRILQVLTRTEARTCKDVMTRDVIFARPQDKIIEISEKMVKHDVSQIPVIDGSRVVGTVTEEAIIRRLSSDLPNQTAEKVMTSPLPIVEEDTDIEEVRTLLKKNQGVLITKSGKIIGIITRSDLLKALCKLSKT